MFSAEVYRAPESRDPVSPIGPDEVPPTYIQDMIKGGMPMVTCRVCQELIDITGKREQHVVKCSMCFEATVIPILFSYKVSHHVA